MSTSDNISAIEAIEKAMEGGYWAASVYDCRPPRSRRDNPLKHSRIITVHGKFATEAEALSAGADAIKNGWTGSCTIDRDTATHSATFELSRSSVSDLVRAMSAILAEARKAEAMKREIAEKDAKIDRLCERLDIGPQGEDAIDVAESAMGHLLHRIETLKREIAELREVLNPFSSDDDQWPEELGDVPFNFDHIRRRARTLLNGGSDAQG